MAATEQDLQLHQALLAGDLAAAGRVYEQFLDDLYTVMRAAFARVQDDTLIYDGVMDAIRTYIENPGAYDPAKLSLLSYLRMSARGDIKNLLDRERRRIRRLVPLAVEDPHTGRNRGVEPAVEDDIDYDRLDRDPEQAARLWQRVLEEFPDARDRELLKLKLDGVRESGPYARILGLDGSDVNSKKLVKKHKDRIDKRLVRLGVKLRE